jgi:hypothetical protein
MIQTFSRVDIFKNDVFVDNQIALAQQAIYRTVNHDDVDELVYTMPFLDHLQAFHPAPKQLDEFCVLAYGAKTKEDYENNFPLVMLEFFTALKIEQVYILTEIKTDWKDFVFENKEKHTTFLTMVNHQTNAVGFLVQVKDLPVILPLFFFKHPDQPHINIIPQGGYIAIDQFLCKDGNLHTLFDKKNYEVLNAVASKAGLFMGSFEVCQLYNNKQF